MRILLLCLVVPLLAMVWADDQPAEKAKPPYERLLKGEDAKTAAGLEKQVAELEEADKYAEALKAAEELTALRTRVQGEDHWQVRDALLQVAVLRKVGALPPEERQQVRDADAAIKRGFTLNGQGKYRDAQPLYEKALAIQRKVLGEEHPKTGSGYNGLAYTLNAQGKFAEAQPLFQKALAIKRKAIGEDHPDTGTGYNNLAYNLNSQGRYAEAQPLYEKGLAIWREAYGEENPNTATGYNNVASNLNAQGKYREAQPLYEKSLELMRKARGEEHPSTAIGYFNLAANLNVQEKFREAQPLYEKALAIWRKTLGEEHPSTATAYGGLASNLNSQGKYDEAQPLYEKTLAIRRKALGEEHPSTASAYNGVAYNLNAQGKYGEAQPLFEKALAIKRKTLGEEHPETGKSYTSLAFNLMRHGKYGEAQPLFEKGLAIQRASGEERPDTATAYGVLAANLNHQGKYTEAQPLFEKALAINRKTLGEEHRNTAATYNNLAANLNAQGKYGEAQPLYEKTLAIQRNVLGKEHPETANGYWGLATNLHLQGKYDAAQPLYEKALEIRRKALGDEHPETANAYDGLAHNLNKQGKYGEAQPLYEKALAICQKSHGEEHPDTAKSYHNVAVNLSWQGKYAEAQPLFEKAVALNRKVLGEEHPNIVNCYLNLACNREAQGKHAEAFAELQNAIRSYECSRLVGASGLERSVASGLKSPYPLNAIVLVHLGQPAKAFDSLEHDLARGLLDQLAQRDAHDLSAEELRQTTEISGKLDELRSRLLYLLTLSERSTALQKELDGLIEQQRRLEAPLADLAAARSQREVAKLDAIRKSLPPDAALVAWVDVSAPGVDDHWGCVVRAKGEPAWERLPGTGADRKWTKPDKDLPGRLLRALTGDRTTAPASPAEVATLTDALHAQRLAPLEKHLDGVKTLFVVPAGSMSGIPVEVLTDRYRISYVPSATYLARLKDRPQSVGERVLALGDPRFDVDTGKPMPVGPLPPGGLLVNQVLPNGPAAAARINPGDVILTYADTDIKDLDQLSKLVADKASDKTVSITIWRDGKTAVREMPSGKLGVVLDKSPAPEAIATKRKSDALLASVRGDDWKELPGTRIELTSLRTLFGPDRVTVLADVHATEPELEALRTADRLKEFRYLHFATHGEANHVSAFQSQLILAQDKAAREAMPRAGLPTLDGKLTAREVLEFWKLDAELVTLSACETALGRQGGGDGQLGFAQAFLTAGSRSVCLSLWKVDDSATALLMDRFYQNLAGKRDGLKAPLGKADALAEAKTWLRNLSLEEATQRLGTITDGAARGKDQPALKVIPLVAEPKANPKEVKPFAHPRYWAAFVLIGEPD